MCQVMIFTDVSMVKDKKKLINAVSEEITKHDNDGFGYAFNGRNGVFGEKALNAAFYKHYEYKKPKPFIKSSSEYFGSKGELIGPALFHGRTSTNHVNMVNTHPIQKRGWTLIHNGVVENQGPKYDMITSNDTEHVIEYLSTTGVSGIEKYLTGYYAVGAIDPQGQLHVIRDDRAGLKVAYINEIKSWVFGTTEALIYNVCVDMKWTYTRIDEFSENTYCIFNKNEMVECRPIKPLGWSIETERYAGASLHYLNSHIYDATKGESPGRFNDNTGPQDDITSDGLREVSDLEADYLHDLTAREMAISSHEMWMEEVRHMDASYEIYNQWNIPISVRDFDKMSEIDQKMCTIYRPDGTVLDYEDYYTNKLA